MLAWVTWLKGPSYFPRSSDQWGTWKILHKGTMSIKRITMKLMILSYNFLSARVKNAQRGHIHICAHELLYTFPYQIEELFYFIAGYLIM